MQEEEPAQSPTIEEEETEDGLQSIDSRLQETHEAPPLSPEGLDPDPEPELDVQPEPEPDPGPDPPSTAQERPRTTSITHTAATVEARAADKRENEQLKAKIRTLDKKLLDNREQLKAVDALQADKSRYESIIQTLQKKLKTNQSDLSSLRTKYSDLENAAQTQAQANHSPDRSAELESEIELATLDKELAIERAELYFSELEALKSAHEELSLEADILREENRELGSSMSAEERGNAGWMAMQKEQGRLRDALVMLRDMSQANEGSLRGELRELQGSLDELQGTARKNVELVEKLRRTEVVNENLKEQLEAAEQNDDVLLTLSAQHDQSVSTIEVLRRQVQELEEHIQVTDELESFHVEEEKRLHYALDESQSQVAESQRHTTDQAKSIEDLEYTLAKFRSVVQGLQGDIDEMRRSREISETQASEMSSKSRAMMDLNLQLQNSASKTQVKTIEFEMGRMQAEQAKTHLDIMQLFVPESFDADRNPVLALLCFKRIGSKAILIKNLLAERMRDRPQLTDEPFMVFEIMEKMSRVGTLCRRLSQSMSTCSPDEFSRYGGALYELEPVERCLTGWVEALKRDELGVDRPETMQRMIGILQDLCEKLITDGSESKAVELLVSCSMVESYTESAAQQLSAIAKATQDRLGTPNDEDEESQVFDKRMDQFGTKTRTIRYLAGKMGQVLEELRGRSMCIGEPSWVFFEAAEHATQRFAELVRQIGTAVVAELGMLDRDDDLSYGSIIGTMTITAQTTLLERDPQATVPDDVFTLLASQLQSLQSKVDDLQSKASDITTATEFEVKPAPWTTRVKALKAQKVISQDAQEELSRMKQRAQEQMQLIAEKDRVLEEQQIKVDLLESRAKDVKKNSADVNALGAIIEKIEKEKKGILAESEKMKKELEVILIASEVQKVEMERLKSAAVEVGGAAAVAKAGEQSEDARQLRVHVDMLRSEILSLQSAVRYLRTENQELRVPVGELALSAQRNAWLMPENLGKHNRMGGKLKEREKLKRQGEDVLEGLIDLAGSMKPVRLRQRGPTEKGWQRIDQTTRWQVAKQREEVERWVEWRDEVVKRGKVEGRTKGRAPRSKLPDLAVAELVVPAAESGWEKVPLAGPERAVKQVRILGSP